MKVGDLVRRTYGEGSRPVGLVVAISHGDPSRWPKTARLKVKWAGSGKSEDFDSKYLEVINASR